MRSALLLLALALFVSACAEDTPPADEPAPVVSAEADDPLTQRPDPLNPQGEDLATPTTWTVRFDQGGHDEHADHTPTVGADSTADVFFVNMTPGWHITTGPAAIFTHPASTAESTYRVESQIHLFDPEGRNEAYGLLLGGQNLDGDDQAYDYFVIRNSGEFLIKRRTGAETETLQDWTSSDAIVRFDETTEGTATNTLAVEVDTDEAIFFINDTEVARMPAEAVQTDGIVGLRVNHALNLHVETLSVTEL